MTAAAYCPSCGRKCGNALCTETPKGADAWKRVARKSASPSLTDTTAGT